ncbi:reverse transcriptase domain-containing protein [Tanacetum coccineum]
MLRDLSQPRFTELTQVDTFYNSLNENDQDSLNAAAGGNLLRWFTDLGKVLVVTPAPVKAVEEICVTCSGPHAWYNCPNTDNNQASVCAATGTYNQVNPPNRVSNQMAPPGFAPVQNNGQNRFNQNQVQGNNFNRGNNFHGNQGFQAQNNHAPNFQNQGFQNQPFQVPNNQVQQEFSNDFSSYKRTNDQMMRNMQNQINSLKGEVKIEIQNTMKTQAAVLMNQQNVFQTNLQNLLSGFFQNQASTSGTLPSNTIPNPKVERETEKTTDKEQSNFQGSTAQIPPPVTPIPTPEPDVPKNLPKPNIPYPSRRNDQKSRDKASNQMEKIFQIFQDLRFDISFADALLLMPRFALTIKSLLMNKEKLLELAKIPLNENCLAMLLKKLLEKLGDPGKFLIPCDFPGMDVCHALADLGVSINLMPLSIWKNLSLHELTPTRMTLELADRSRTKIFETSRALIDVYEGELILRDGDERLIFHVNKHPQKHAKESIKMINFIEDSFGEVLRLKKSNHFSSGSTTPLSDSSPSLTSFETSDSLLEEFADELALLDPFPQGNEDVDFEANLREIELLLNRDPSTKFSPMITIDPNPNKFTDKPAPACLPPPGDDESFLKEDRMVCVVWSGGESLVTLFTFKEMLEEVESKDSTISTFDKPVLLNTPLFDEDECFDPEAKLIRSILF